MSIGHYTALLVIALLTTSCDFQSTPFDSETAAIQAVQAFEDPVERKLAYTMLTASEKKALWTGKTTEMALSKALNPAQQDVIRELEAFVQSYDGWGLQLTGRRFDQVLAFERGWLQRAKTVFSDEQVRAIAYDVQAVGALTKDFTVGIPASAVDESREASGPSQYGSQVSSACICSIGSAFTCPFYECTAGSGFGCTVKYGSCEAGISCLTSEGAGCGFMGLHVCDGDKCIRDGDRGGSNGGGGNDGGGGNWGGGNDGGGSDGGRCDGRGRFRYADCP